MSKISKNNAIEFAKKFLEKDGIIVIECIHIAHASKELLESELDYQFEQGNFVIEFSIVTPNDAKYKITDPRGDTRAICVYDVTGVCEYT